MIDAGSDGATTTVLGPATIVTAFRDPEVITDGETGYLCPVGDVKTMADRAVALLSDSGAHQRFKRRARKRAVGCFGAARIIPQYEAYYEEILKT